MSTIVPQVPAVEFGGRSWSRDVMTGLVAEWWRALRAHLPKDTRFTATALANRPESIALLGALSALPYPVVILSEDPRSWRSTPALPEDTAFVLNAWQDGQAAAARAQGFQVVQLPTGTTSLAALPPGLALFSCPGFINFTSGSTGLPKPVYRRAQSALRANLHTARAMGAKPGDGIIGTLPLSTTFGFGSVVAAGYGLGSEIALLERFDPRVVLNLFATRRYEYFPAAPVMRDGRSARPLSAGRRASAGAPSDQSRRGHAADGALRGVPGALRRAGASRVWLDRMPCHHRRVSTGRPHPARWRRASL
jgi:acyl-CoA synthetase (AMP-forming)/AMP-acid ligase II